MNSRLTIAVLLILIVLVGVVAYVSRQPPPAHPVKRNFVFAGPPTSLERFSYRPANGPMLSFKHVGTHWWIVSPINARGRDYSIGDLADTLAHLKWRYRTRIAATGPHSLAQTGLEKPHAVLTLVNETGKTFTLNIGRRNSTGRLYVHLAGAHDPYIDIVQVHWLDRLDRPVRKFRNRSLASLHTRNVAAIILHSATSTIRLVPHHAGWLITKPLLAPAEESAVTSWISNLQLLTAHRFSEVPADRAGFKNAALTVTVLFKHPAAPAPTALNTKKTPVKVAPAPAPLVIQFGLKTDLTGKFLYAQSSYNPGVCVVRSTSFEQLNQGISKLRDSHLVTASASKASSCVIKRAAGITANTPASLALTKVGDQWRLNVNGRAGPSIPASGAAVTKLLTDLHAATAKNFLDFHIDPAALGLVHPRATWQIKIPDHVHPIGIAFGTPQKSGLVPVKVAQWPSVYMIGPAAIKPLLPMLTNLRSKTVVNLTRVKLRRIAIRQAGHAAVLTNRKGRWMMGAKSVAPEAALNNMLAAWKPLRAKQWFVDQRSVSAVPPITVDMTILKPVKAAIPATLPAKAVRTNSRIQYVPAHDVLTLWRINVPTKRATTTGTAKPATPSAIKTQWRAELTQTGEVAGAHQAVWSFQPTKKLAAAVQALLKQAK